MHPHAQLLIERLSNKLEIIGWKQVRTNHFQLLLSNLVSDCTFECTHSQSVLILIKILAEQIIMVICYRIITARSFSIF
jgi:hypothetical protein